MSECTCGVKHEAPTEEIVEAEKSEALDNPIVELDKKKKLKRKKRKKKRKKRMKKNQLQKKQMTFTNHLKH